MQPTMNASVYGRSDIHAPTTSHTSLSASSEVGGTGLTLAETLLHPSISPAQSTDFGFRRHQFPHFRDDSRRYCDAAEVPILETGVARVCDFDASKSSAYLPSFHPPTQLYTAMALGSDAVAAAAVAADSVVALESSLGRLRSPHFGVSPYQQSHSLVSHQLPLAQPQPLQTVPPQVQIPPAPQSASTARIRQLFNNINRPTFYPPTSEKVAATSSLEFAYDNDGGTVVGSSAVAQPFEYANMLHWSTPFHLQGQKASDRIRGPSDQTITTGDSPGTCQTPSNTQQQMTKLRPQDGFSATLSQASSSSLTTPLSCSTSTSRRRLALSDAHTNKKVGGLVFATGQVNKERTTGDFMMKLEGTEEMSRRSNGNEGSVNSGGIAESTASGTGVVIAAANAARSSYMCRKCRAHGRLVPVRQHKRNCPYKHCNCSVCSLVNYGRHIVAKQIALYRDQKNHQLALAARTTGDSETAVDGKRRGGGGGVKDRLQTGAVERSIKATTMEEEGPHCRRCRNHGKTNPWKGHKKACPFYYCICQQCILITLRKSNEKNLREVVQEVNKEGGLRLPIGVPSQPPILLNPVNNSASLIPPTCEEIFHQPNSSLFPSEQATKVDTEEPRQAEKSSLAKFTENGNCFKMPLMHFTGAAGTEADNCRKSERTSLMATFEDSCPGRQRVSEELGQSAKFPFTAGYPWILRDSLNYASNQSPFASSVDTTHEFVTSSFSTASSSSSSSASSYPAPEEIKKPLPIELVRWSQSANGNDSSYLPSSVPTESSPVVRMSMLDTVVALQSLPRESNRASQLPVSGGDVSVTMPTEGANADAYFCRPAEQDDSAQDHISRGPDCLSFSTVTNKIETPGSGICTERNCARTETAADGEDLRPQVETETVDRVTANYTSRAHRAAAIAAAAAAAVALHHKASFKHVGLPLNCLTREEEQGSVEPGKMGHECWNPEFQYQINDFGILNVDSRPENRACFESSRACQLKWDSTVEDERDKQEQQRLPLLQTQNVMMEGTTVALEAAAGRPVGGECRGRTAEWNMESPQEDVGYKGVKGEQDQSLEAYNAMLTRHGCWNQADFRANSTGTLLRSVGKLGEWVRNCVVLIYISLAIIDWKIHRARDVTDAEGGL
ncbi:hypothetical protein AAHC03_0654 [Spirometra sp. Aus1]